MNANPKGLPLRSAYSQFLSSPIMITYIQIKFVCLAQRGILEKGFSFYAVFLLIFGRRRGGGAGGEGLAKVSLVTEYI